MTRTDAINYVIQKKEYKSYLEIGIQKGINFENIKVGHKVGVDPDRSTPATRHMKSDDFFKQNAEKFDVIFIDGMHTAEQSMKDFNNACYFINDGGVIILHDVLPHNEEYTKPIWCGDVWKTAKAITIENMTTCFSKDHGVLFVWENNKIESLITGKYPGLSELQYFHNSTDQLDELLPNNNDLFDQDEQYNAYTDDELKEAYKEKFGSKPRGKFIRVNIIQKLLSE